MFPNKDSGRFIAELYYYILNDFRNSITANNVRVFLQYNRNTSYMANDTCVDYHSKSRDIEPLVVMTLAIPFVLIVPDTICCTINVSSLMLA